MLSSNGFHIKNMKKDLGIDMTTKQQSVYELFPTLQEVSLVKKALIEMENSILTFPDLYNQVKKKMSKTKLLTILEYFEHRNMVVTSPKGITWIYNRAIWNMQGCMEYDDKDGMLKEINEKRKEKRDIKWNKIVEEDDMIPLEKL